MAKHTLLYLTQDILNDISGDEVNHIDDTIESAQIAQIIRSTYEAMMSSRNWPHTKKLIQVDPSGTSALPTHMTLPDNVKQVSLVNYNRAKLSDGSKNLFQEILYIEPDDFLRMCNTRNNLASTTVVIDDPSSGISFNIRNDVGPTYFTSFDDKTLIFDSYDSSVDSTLQKSKIQVYAYTVPAWNHVDDFIPDLPDAAFTGLLEEAKSRAALKVRQQPDQKAEQEAQRQRKWFARNDRRMAGGIKFPNYGRNSGYNAQRRDPTFRRDN